MAVPGMEQWDPGLFAFPRTQPTSQCPSPSASWSSWPNVTEDDPYDVRQRHISCSGCPGGV